MLDDVLALLIELAESADTQIIATALDRHQINDPELRSALLSKDSQALMRILGPDAPLPNNSSVYSVGGNSNMDLNQDGGETKFTLTPDINITITSDKNTTEQYQVTSGNLVAKPRI